MTNKRKRILIFGVGELQRSIIRRAKKRGLYTVGIDPNEDAVAKDEVDVFEVVGGKDFEGTCAVIEKYNIDAIVTSATDKPLVMMARVAEHYQLPCFSMNAAIYATDKYQMKQHFQAGGVPCAKGRLIKTIEEADGLTYPLIIKPRDNSGSRGVIKCEDYIQLEAAMQEAFQFTHLDSLLVEEFIEGQAYSIEGFHHDGITEVYQFTEKRCTPFPYTAELGHKQPAVLSDKQKDDIREIIHRIGVCLDFHNCPSHTELKINDRGIFVLETSPRLAGDYNASTLIPLSTGINVEDQLLNVVTETNVDLHTGRQEKSSAICWISLPQGTIGMIDKELYNVSTWPHVKAFEFKLKVGDNVNQITNSLNRYGYFICQADTREEIDKLMAEYEHRIKTMIMIK